MKYLLMIAILFITSNPGEKKAFSGEWAYHYSIAKSEIVKGNISQPADREFVIDSGDFLTGQKLVFGISDSKTERKDMPETVVNMRKNDPVFKNVVFTAFTKDGKRIDTFYPASHNGGKEDQVHFTAYGKRYKDDFLLDFSKKDTLIITDNKLYSHEGHKYSRVGHVYVKVMQ